MNAHVHPIFGDLLEAIGGAPDSPELRTADETHGMRETIKSLRRRLDALIPEVSTRENRNTPWETEHWFSEDVRERAVIELLDRKYELLEEICIEISEKAARHDY